LGLNGHLGVVSAQGPLPSYDALAQQIAGVPGVVRVVPLVEQQVMATAQGRSTGALVRGIRLDDLKKGAVGTHMSQGSVDAMEEDGVVIGSRMAFKLGLKIGDDITLISPQGNATPFGTVPRIKAYRVAGMFDIGMYEYDSSYVFLPLEAAQGFFKTGDAVT